MEVTILGAGIAGLSLACFLQESDAVERITLLEKTDRPGGLCKSIQCGECIYDIGPHIIFSKDEEVLSWMRGLLHGNENILRRSNQILYKGRYIQYPFENDLSKLPEEDLDYCIRAFKQNPYEKYVPENMLQFFLKTFGEGITNIYLRPYNEKIWKFDPAYMNTQMVDRIPKPTNDEIERSAAGETVDGYLHQLYFSYPSAGGIEALVHSMMERLGDKCRILVRYDVGNVQKTGNKYSVRGRTQEQPGIESDVLVSTIPIQELTRAYFKKNETLNQTVRNLKYNSIKVFLIRTKEDLCGENFTFTIPDRNIVFHRISKMDFLGPAYQYSGASYIAEITYREGDQISGMADKALAEKVISGVVEIGFADSLEDVKIVDVTDQKYAYVIYDLLHKENMKKIRRFFSEEGIYLTGRFGNFEYWNMDRVICEAKKISARISENGGNGNE